MLAAGESDIVEFKETLADAAGEKIMEAICAFANDLPGHARSGVVFVGVRDDGAPMPEHSVTNQDLATLGGWKSDGRIVPPPTLTVVKRTLRGCDVAVIEVAPSASPPVRFKGRTHIRTGPRRDIATVQEELILIERRRHRDKPFDIQPVPSATVADLNRRIFEEEYLPQAVAPDVLTRNERSYEQRLAVTKMVVSADEPTPTIAGMLTLGIRPQDFIPGAYIQFLRLDGLSLADPDPVIDEKVIDGSLGDVLRRIDEKLASHNRVRVRIDEGPLETRYPDYPLLALQQLVRNAVMHRNYEGTNAPVRVMWFNDRIEIVSPGGPYGAVTERNFGQPGLADYRNPTIAEVMRVLGFVQKFGIGIATALGELRRNGNPDVIFDVQPTTVLCRVDRVP